ncbi:hypothetical protein [Microbacterium pumilum]|uniref:hypothetical protein n=1 Tax=Microbacterium pumilum TaxID=344165 RepID=UPI0031DCE004
MSDTRRPGVVAPAVVTETLPLWACGLLGVAAALVGLLPWLATGMRLPIQNLWAVETSPEAMPFVLLPFSQYSLSHVFGLIVTGSAAAGIVARAARPRLPRGGFALQFAGVLVVQIAATVQTAVVVRSGLQERPESTLYLAVLVTLCILSILVGAGALALIARAPRAGALIGLTIGAIAVSEWIGVTLRPLTMMSVEWAYNVVGLFQWVTPVLVGIAIAWAGINTIGKIVGALASLVLIWVAPALMTGVGSAAGSYVLAHDPPAMIEYGLQVFQMALFIPELALRPIIAAVVVATIGFVVRWVLGRRQRSEEQHTGG